MQTKYLKKSDFPLNPNIFKTRNDRSSFSAKSDSNCSVQIKKTKGQDI